METGQRTEEVCAGQLGKTDTGEGNEKDCKRTVKISEPIYWCFFLIKYSERSVSIRWRREHCKLIIFPEED